MKNMKARSIKKDIAIVGMSGKFPKSENIAALWKNLAAGNELIDFYTDAEIAELGISEEIINNPNFIKSSSLIDDPGSFDHSFFGYTREEAALMDPQIRLLHEQVWNSLENAGYNPFNYDKKIGCYFSASDNVNWRTHVVLSEAVNVNPFFVRHIANGNSISRLISYSLNLKGPSYYLDTACSSSLVAVHVACRSLLLKECTIALAGGVSISSSTEVGYLYEEGSIFSKDGHCKAFDSEASGTIGGEGAGVVVLKRLEDALNDKDHIYSVIRATSVNNDGNQKVGYTAPSIIGQHNCIKTAIQIAGIEPTDISYVETHGTGTVLGDPVEVEALNKAFNYDTSHSCAIGSLKSNFGHLDAAAGVAGLIKATLCLDNKALPPSLHFKTPNPQIKFKSGPFFVNTELTEWKSEKPRFAGVSSFGIGGTNVHAVLQEPIPQEKGDASSKFQLILSSARTKSALTNYGNNFSTYLAENQKVDLADLSYTLKIGRKHHKYRKFIVADSHANLAEQMETLQQNLQFPKSDKKGLVFMFSGQGSQFQEMGKQIYEQYPNFKAVIDEGLEILKKETGTDYINILGYNQEEKEDSALINDTIHTQPLLFLIEYAFAKFLIDLGMEPTQMIGHSLGEYVAACVSEVFSFEEGLKLILKRAQLMNEMERGSMLHVNLAADKVQEYISSNISIAAINTDDTCVISGQTELIKETAELLASKEIDAIILKTSHAFHSPMMDPMLKSFEQELNKINWSTPKFAFVSCTTGAPITNEEAMSATYWVNHLRQTVSFNKGLDYLLSEGFSKYVEIGAARTLLTFLKQNKNSKTVITATAVLKHPKEKKDDSYYLLNALGTLWSAGLDVDWTAYYEGQARNRIPAPTYAFDKMIFPCKVNPIQKLIDSNALNGMNGGALNDFSYSNEVVSKQDQNEDENAINTAIIAVERPDLNAEYLKAESETEKELTTLWKSLFGYEKIGINDDFFELGGDSLKATTILRKIHKTFNVEVSIGDFFEKCDIQQLAKEIDLAIEVRELNKNTDKPATSNQIRF
ncbi:MAG: phthiocerol/phenolphthiocerol synthesis type-I polyketide synthase E [Crocinitomix sp.]|jgi:phthiocerol/phenolphthiocerol synthesis type-I polyketide synthase E